MAAFAANLGIAVSKTIAFAITGATSLLAEAIHSFADSGNQGLLLLGGRRARRGPDAEHPFGYGRERYFWAFVVSLVLFSVGGLFAIYEGVHKVSAPEPPSSVVVGFIVLGVAIGLEAFSLRTAVKETGHVKPAGQGYPRFIRRTKQPELAVVLLEDVGALVGLVFALVGLTLAEVTGDARYDGIGSIAIGVLLVGISAVLAREMKSLLIGEAAEADTVRLLTDALAATPHLRGVVGLTTLQLGPDDLLVAAKVDVAPDLPAQSLSDAINDAEARMRSAVPTARVILIEPEVREPARA